jgi:hypothetical protein
VLSEQIGALCSDFYVNQKMSLKLDLPTARETVLDMFDRVRRDLPRMDRFRRYDDELALESPEMDSRYSWLALGRTAIRSGWVNPEVLEDAYGLHRLILELAPYFLSISPLDMDSLEIMFGVDLEADRNRNEVVFDALFAGSPLREMVADDEALVDAQPFIGFALEPGCSRQAFVEIKTRTRTHEIAAGRFDPEPISIYLTVRSYGPFRSIEDLSAAFDELTRDGERLVMDRLLPHVVQPLRAALYG